MNGVGFGFGVLPRTSPIVYFATSARSAARGARERPRPSLAAPQGPSTRACDASHGTAEDLISCAFRGRMRAV